MRNQWLTWKSAAIGASALITLGVLAVAIDQADTATTTSGTMSFGQTVTTTTPPSAPPTSVATPNMKAAKPKGF
jgi:hypothetical protein